MLLNWIKGEDLKMLCRGNKMSVQEATLILEQRRRLIIIGVSFCALAVIVS